MKKNTKKFAARLIDTNGKTNNDMFPYYENNNELDMLLMGNNYAAPEDYYYFWNSSNPTSIISAMREYIHNRRIFETLREIEDEREQEYMNELHLRRINGENV